MTDYYGSGLYNRDKELRRLKREANRMMDGYHQERKLWVVAVVAWALAGFALGAVLL